MNKLKQLKKSVFMHLTPQEGFEPTTNRLTADCSTAELLRIFFYNHSIPITTFQDHVFFQHKVDQTDNIWYSYLVSGRGEIGRHARFRF